MTDTAKIYEAIDRAVKLAITEVGVDSFKRTSLFMSARRTAMEKIAA